MGMMHSSSLECSGFSEYGDARCIMGGGATTFNAPQRLTHGWITKAPQFAHSNIYPHRTLHEPPGPTSEVCVLTPASLGNHVMPKPKPPPPYARWRIRRLQDDPQAPGGIGDCSIVYVAKEGHEADPASSPTSWQATLLDESIVDLGSHSQLVLSYDGYGYLSVHTHAAWGALGDWRRPVLLDSISRTTE